MRLVSSLYIFLACATLPALAAAQAQSAPATTPTTQPSSTTQTPSPTASTTTPASSSSAHPANPKELTDAEKKLISSGYRLEVHNGEKTFCRREIVVGSHFEKKVCGTADQLAASRQTSREVIESTQRYGTNPTG